MLVAVLLVALGYLCGAIPFGLLLARRSGVDVRRSGSGNIGATNVARTAGTPLGLVTLLADVLKGALPVLLARWLATDLIAAATGLAAFVGHIAPVPLRFAGGKGVATALGVLAVLCPAAAGFAALVFVAVLTRYGYVSLASILAAVAAPVTIGLLSYPLPYKVVALLMSVGIVVRHRDNLHRLRIGTEARFTLHKKQAPLSK